MKGIFIFDEPNSPIDAKRLREDLDIEGRIAGSNVNPEDICYRVTPVSLAKYSGGTHVYKIVPMGSAKISYFLDERKHKVVFNRNLTPRFPTVIDANSERLLVFGHIMGYFGTNYELHFSGDENK